MSFFDNTRKPVGLGGKIMVAMMNSGHGAMADWGFGHIAIPEAACILDAGCGGGANIKKLLAKCPKGIVKGIDYSEVSVEKSRKVNAKAISEGRCEVLLVISQVFPPYGKDVKIIYARKRKNHAKTVEKIKRWQFR